MRPLELLLLITLVPPILFTFLPKERPKWVLGLPIGAFLLLVLHGRFEGMRWQMMLAYLLTAVFTAHTAITLNKEKLNFIHKWVPKAARRGKSFLLGLFGTLLWLITLLLATLLPVPKLMPATGQYQVGTTILHLIDEKRLETYTNDPHDYRELMAQIWYPTTQIAQANRVLYLPNLDISGPIVAEQFELPPFLLNHINLTKLDIFEDAPLADESTPFPVIIFSHGLTGLRTQNTAMFQELASHGFIVGSLDHTFANAITIFPDGRVVLYDGELVFPTDDPLHVQANGLINIWAEDIGFLLDEMTMWNGDGGVFNGRIDMGNVGIFGHSTGGGTAIEFCLIDDRCKAGIGLDSWVLPVSESRLENGPNQPFMFISSPLWLGDENRGRGLEIFNRLPNNAYNLTLANTGHYDFSDLVMLSPITPLVGLSGKIDSHYSIGIQNEYILAFFNQYLKGVDGDAVLKRPSPYPELTINQR